MTQKNTKHKRTPKPQTLRNIIAATRLVAQGFTQAEAAEKLGMSHEQVKWLRFGYPEEWSHQLKKEQTKALKAIRKAAGTEAVFTESDRYIQLAKKATRAAQKRGEPLFKPSGEQTLTQFFESCFVPLSEAKKSSLSHYRMVLKQWQWFSGDPPLKDITSPMLAEFKRFLSQLPGRHKHAKAETVRKKLRHIQAVLYKAGPAGPRNRDAMGVIPVVPWVRPPKPQLSPPKPVSEKKLNDCYLAAAGMDKPKIPGIKPAAWWRALIVMAFNTGLRRRTLFELRMKDIDWHNNRLVIPPDQMKAGRVHFIHLNRSTMDHLRKIRTDRELVFPRTTKGFEWFHAWFHKLQDLAGIPREEHFGLQNLRQTCASSLFGINPGAATAALGHAGSNVTLRHYVDANSIVADALDALPQPAAFVTVDEEA